MPVNVKLMQRTMRYIERHPKEWDQRTFVSECGTTACFAGRACALDGGVWLDTDRMVLEVNGDDKRKDVSLDYYHSSCGPVIEPYVRAKRILGLTGREADSIFFDMTSSPSKLRKKVDAICAKAEAKAAATL